MICPHCRRRYVRMRRDKVACRACCDQYTNGYYDRRFRLAVLARAE
jgi:hypothetical protein